MSEKEHVNEMDNERLDVLIDVFCRLFEKATTNVNAKTACFNTQDFINLVYAEPGITQLESLFLAFKGGEATNNKDIRNLVLLRQKMIRELESRGDKDGKQG